MKTYEAPTIEILGSATTLTQGADERRDERNEGGGPRGGGSGGHDGDGHGGNGHGGNGNGGNGPGQGNGNGS